MRSLRLALVALLVLLAAGCHSDSVEDAEPVETVTAVPVPNTDDPVLDADQEQTQLDRPEGVDAMEDSVDETPPGISETQVEQIEESRPAGIGEPLATGGAELLSCKVHPVRNFSARAQGSKTSQVVLHYTVSAPGTLDAIWNLFNTSAFGASSHLLLEPSGRCEQIVDYSKKAWTAGAFNSVSDQVEIVCCRTDPTRAWWLAQPILSKSLLASWVVDRLRARGLPPRLVDPEGCTPLAGYTDHNRLECGNTHTDVGRNFPFDVLRRQVSTLYNAGATKLVWRAMSAGRVLQTRRYYRGLLAWMLGDGVDVVKKAESENGAVSIRRVTIPLGG